MVVVIGRATTDFFVNFEDFLQDIDVVRMLKDSIDDPELYIKDLKLCNLLLADIPKNLESVLCQSFEEA